MPLPGISVSASSTQITMGGSVTIRWSVDGAPGAELLDYTSSQWKAVPLSGSKSYTLPNQGNYNFFIRATGPGGSAQNYVRVDVLQAAPMVSPAVAAVTPAVTVNPPATTTPAAQGVVPPAATAPPSAIGGFSSNYLLLAAGAVLLFLVFSGRAGK